jgi:tripartite-type tricarboxylate transporter receptor subunit TctC
VRALAVTTKTRSAFLPDTPTLDEAGLKGFDLSTWWGVMAPARTPQPVIDRLAGEIAKAIEAPEVNERLRAMGSEAPTVRSPEAFTAFVASEIRIYAALVKRAGASVD